jgi:hypothetical protein
MLQVAYRTGPTLYVAHTVLDRLWLTQSMPIWMGQLGRQRMRIWCGAFREPLNQEVACSGHGADEADDVQAYGVKGRKHERSI